MSKEQVTVVIPTRADGRGLDRAVDSVLGQRGSRPLLLIVVDGDSASAHIDRRCLDGLTQPHRVVFAGHHGRPAPLRNRGLALATTPLISFLDDDDEWEPDKLARQLEAMAATKAVLVGSNATKVRHGHVLGPYFPDALPTNLGLAELIQTNWLITSTVLTSTAALGRVGGFPVGNSMRFCDDYVAWLKLLTLGRGQIVEEALVRYSVGSNNSLSDRDSMSGAELRQVALQQLMQDSRSFRLTMGWQVRRSISRVMRS